MALLILPALIPSSTPGSGETNLLRFMRNIVFQTPADQQGGAARRAGKWIAASLTALLFAASVQAKPAIIVRNGRSDYQIVTPEDKSPAVGYAAEELQRFIQQMTGVQLPVVSEKRAGRKPAFLLGPCNRSRKAGLIEQAGQLREDGVLIKTVGKDIALLGKNERGNLYSVYVLLETYFGMRFLA